MSGGGWVGPSIVIVADLAIITLVVLCVGAAEEVPDSHPGAIPDGNVVAGERC